MKKTKVRVYFSLFGDTFPLDDVSKSLEINQPLLIAKANQFLTPRLPDLEKKQLGL
ncbi:hypothetical protein [Paenibacillus auburnensis]|uniref:hypothetical protein n=1 Tax=Paenibacillus auburnensis TaxID=2905649 RepID=UPI001F42EF14|nr:hypothetical protein [Paenibacillus auburnensis]